MPSDPIELAKARELLGKFETEMHKSEAITHLAEALLLLADVRTDAESEGSAQVATNVALSYATKVQGEVQALLAHDPIVHWEVVDHWQKVFAEFERAGFVLPQAAAAARSQLLYQKAQREIRLMSAAERQELIRQLQAMDDK